jgi:hypothetical protein
MITTKTKALSETCQKRKSGIRKTKEEHSFSSCYPRQRYEKVAPSERGKKKKTLDATLHIIVNPQEPRGASAPEKEKERPI